jgi:hypothetical protein
MMLGRSPIGGRRPHPQPEGDVSMEHTTFDARPVRPGTGMARCKLLGRVAKTGAGTALGALLLVGVGAAVLPASAAGPCQTGDGLDPDRDGLSCNEEAVRFGTDPLVYDTDGDSLGDGDEVYTYGTDPLVYDTDGDGVSDGNEIYYWGTNPLVADPFGIAAGRDSDGDGLSDHDERRIYYTDPFNWDTDGDGYGDGYEVAQGASPIGGGCNLLGCG